MAFTKAPVTDTHNVQRVMASGTSFIVSNPLNDVEPESLNYINCYPEGEKQFNGEDRKTIQKREGWLREAINCTHTTAGSYLSQVGVHSPAPEFYPKYFYPKGASYYSVTYNSDPPLGVLVYTPASGNPVSASGTAFVDSANALRIAFLCSAGYLTAIALDGVSGDTLTNLSALGIDGTRGIVFLNGYLFAVGGVGNKIYNSSPGGVYTTWNSTDFLAAEQYADPVQWIDSHKNCLVAFGTSSIEFFYDAAIEVGSPLARHENYSRRVGIRRSNTDRAGRNVARIGDDLYFIGTTETSPNSLYRIRNFQVEEIQCAFFKNLANALSNETPVTAGIETIVVNNNSMILINVDPDSYSIVYYPDEDAWWMLQQSTPTLYDFPEAEYRIGTSFYAPTMGRSFFLSANATTASTVYLHTPDIAHTVSTECEIYSEVVDFGTNYYKHIARVDAIGDFGDNTITLYYNGAPNYQNDYTVCAPTSTVSTTTSGRNSSWYNLGAYRRMSFKIKMAGLSHSIFEGLDIEYNAGQA